MVDVNHIRRNLEQIKYHPNGFLEYLRSGVLLSQLFPLTGKRLTGTASAEDVDQPSDVSAVEGV